MRATPQPLRLEGRGLGHRLPMPRFYLQGPYGGALREALAWTVADDVRERVCERIRGDVVAMWVDPRERWR